MSTRRLILFILSLLLLAVFLYAAVHIRHEVEIASFSTSIEDRTEDQISNLQLAASRIDGYVLKPGDVFSFNEVVGERLQSWGYKGAPTIYHGRMIYTPGGGLCQLSSTLYNGALLAGFEIIERTPHVWTINSVGPGRDAAILYSGKASLDLKFRNNYNFPAKLSVEIREKKIILRVLAAEKPDYDIYIDVNVLQVFPAPRYPNFPRGQDERSTSTPKGKDGFKVKVYRVFSKNGKIVKRETISVDRYEPVPGGLTN